MRLSLGFAILAAATAVLAAAAPPAVPGASAAATVPAKAGDAARGARLFLQCQACHTVAPDGHNSVGPNLAGVMGARAAGKSGFRYSAALTRAGLVWTPANMDRWLTRPTAMVPGTTMGFAGVADAKNRRDVIAYLATLKQRR